MTDSQKIPFYQQKTNSIQIKQINTKMKNLNLPLKSYLNDQFDKVAQRTGVSKSRSQITIEKMIPYLVIAQLSLIFVGIMSIFLYQTLRMKHFQNLIDHSEPIMREFKIQQILIGFTEIIQGNKNDQCPNGYLKQKLGSFAGTNTGCICPNLQTTTQLCDSSCFKVQNIASQPYYKFASWIVCVKRSQNEKVLNYIEQIDENHNFTNTIHIAGKLFRFSHKKKALQNETDFYQFYIGPSFPCYNPSFAPLQKSKLTYPFSIKPFTGCDKFGQRLIESVLLGTTSQERLFRENNISNQTIQLPFFTSFYRNDDPIQLYILRKVYINKTSECDQTYTYPFHKMFHSCILIQGVCELLSYIGISFMFISLLLLIVTFSMIHRLNNREFCQKIDSQQIGLYTYKHFAKWLLKQIIYIQRDQCEISLRSIIIMFGLMFIFTIVSKITFYYGTYNSYVKIFSHFMLGSLIYVEQIIDSIRYSLFQK